MSVDALGRVIVGSGHFLNQALVAGQHVIVGGGHFLNQIAERTETVLCHAPNMGRHVVSAVAQAESLTGTALSETCPYGPYRAQCVKDAFQRAIVERFPDAQPSPYDPTRFVPLNPKSSSFPTRQDYEEEQWKLLYETAKDILEGAGWALSGDLESALQKELEAVLKLSEVYLNDFKFLFNPPPQ